MLDSSSTFLRQKTRARGGVGPRVEAGTHVARVEVVQEAIKERETQVPRLAKPFRRIQKGRQGVSLRV